MRTEPQYFIFPSYGRYSDLDNEVEEKVNNESFMEDIDDKILDLRSIPVGTRLVKITYDREYYSVSAEKCEFCGFFLTSMDELASDDFMLQFKLIESKSLVNIPFGEAKYTLYGKDQQPEILAAIKDCFLSFVKAKTALYNKIEGIKNLIMSLQKLKVLDAKSQHILGFQKLANTEVSNLLAKAILDKKDEFGIIKAISMNSVLQDDIEDEHEVEGQDNFFDALSDVLVKLLENFYEDNKIYKLEGKKDSNDFVEKLSAFVKDCKTEFSEEIDEDDDNDEENTMHRVSYKSSSDNDIIGVI